MALSFKLTHVEASGNTSALQRLLCGILLASCHETWHLILGEFNLTATKGREADIGNLELVSWSRHCDSVPGTWELEVVVRFGEWR